MVRVMEGGAPKTKETWLYRHALQLLAGYLSIFTIFLGVFTYILQLDLVTLAIYLGAGIFGYGILLKMIWDDLQK